MRYNCETRHGDVLVISTLNDSGASAEVEWGLPNSRRKVRYIFSTPKPISTPDPIANFVVAKLAASHFDRTESPVDAASFAFSIEEIAPNENLRLIPLT